MLWVDFYNMNLSTKKWIILKLSSFILIPFMLWFILSLNSIYAASHLEFLNFFSIIKNKILLSFFLIFAYIFAVLSISEIFEDYIHNLKIKFVANWILFFSGIIFPTITIIVVINFNS